MASSLSDEDVRALDSTRQQLLNLQTSLNALAQDLRSQPSLPSWSALQRHNGIIASTLERIRAQLSVHHDLLASSSVYPLPTFPGAQGHILESLLRSKLEPDVEEWVGGGEALARSTISNQGLGQTDLDELWNWAAGAAQTMSWQQCWRGDYTLAERAQGLDPDQGWDTIETGLDRELEDPGTPQDPDAKNDGEEAEEEDEDEDDEMEGVEEQKQIGSTSTSRAKQVPPMPLMNLHQFMSSGKVA